MRAVATVLFFSLWSVMAQAQAPVGLPAPVRRPWAERPRFNDRRFA